MDLAIVTTPTLIIWASVVDIIGTAVYNDWS